MKKTQSKLKIALVHDGLFTRGGAERVLLNFQKAFPDSPIYTTVYHPNNTYPEFKNSRIITSWFNYLARSEFLFKILFFPFGLLAARSLNLKDYDIILCSTTHCAKYIRVSKKSLVINYCYTPFRLAWNPDSYNILNNIFSKILFAPVIKILKLIDFFFAQRANYYIAMTPDMKKRIQECYKIPSKKIKIIQPSIDTSKFISSESKKDYFLVVSRLEKYKKVEIVIECFNDLNIPLIIVGDGMLEKELKKSANDNITFLKNISDDELIKLYSNCKALIFPQKEDYGLTVLESYASGRPVICYNEGGAKFTGIEFSIKNQLESTMLTFNEQSSAAIKKCIIKFDEKMFDARFIKSHANNFDDKTFISNLIEFVNYKFNNHKSK